MLKVALNTTNLHHPPPLHTQGNILVYALPTKRCLLIELHVSNTHLVHFVVIPYYEKSHNYHSGNLIRFLRIIAPFHLEYFITTDTSLYMQLLHFKWESFKTLHACLYITIWRTSYRYSSWIRWFLKELFATFYMGIPQNSAYLLITMTTTQNCFTVLWKESLCYLSIKCLNQLRIYQNKWVIMIARICIWQPETRGPVVSGEKIKIWKQRMDTWCQVMTKAHPKKWLNNSTTGLNLP